MHLPPLQVVLCRRTLLRAIVSEQRAVKWSSSSQVVDEAETEMMMPGMSSSSSSSSDDKSTVSRISASTSICHTISHTI